jgi:hypothetical protein
MKSNRRGKDTSLVEITITKCGIWLCVEDQEFFLAYEEYPFFQKAVIQDVYNIEFLHHTHLYWPDLDVDLSLEILKNTHNFPLVDRIPFPKVKRKTGVRKKVKKTL